jgi:acetyl-CoA carboxylase biotin carboxyl carrier protein
VNEAKVRKLLEIFRDSGVEEMEYRESFWRGISLRLGRRRAEDAQHVTFAAPPFVSAAPVPPTSPTPAPEESPGAPADDLHAVTSPMVGTFYRSPSPESDPFVGKGDVVKAGQTVAIIEAMKIMNEIHADADGEIVEVAATDGDPVEYGQPLFHIKTE